MDSIYLTAQGAKRIAEALLERATHGLMNADFDAFAECYMLPLNYETYHGRHKITLLEELREIYDRIRDHLARNNVTHMHRPVLAAEHLDPDTIHATHETRLTSGQQLVDGPYPVLSVLRRTGDAWKVASATYTPPVDSGYGRALDVGRVKGD